MKMTLNEIKAFHKERINETHELLAQKWANPSDNERKLRSLVEVLQFCILELLDHIETKSVFVECKDGNRFVNLNEVKHFYIKPIRGEGRYSCIARFSDTPGDEIELITDMNPESLRDRLRTLIQSKEIFYGE